MILTRKQFKEHFNSLDPRLPVRGGPLWIPESFDNKKICCRWFVKVPPVALKTYNDFDEYWIWCNLTMSGEVRCFSSSSEEQEEWWGFTHKRDILFWLLRWA